MSALGIYLRSIQDHIAIGAMSKEAEESQAPQSVPQCDGHSLDDEQ